MAVSLENTWNRHADSYLINMARGFGYTSVREGKRLDFTEVFGRSAPLTVEIGCGSGDQLVAAAQRWPERDFVGLEVWRPGLAKTISKAAEASVRNLRLIEADAVQVFAHVIPPGALSEVWTFFPDPWRKSRHHKRRLVQLPFAEMVAQSLTEGGIWRLATDWDDYAWHMRNVVENTPGYTNPFAGKNPDPRDPEGERGGFSPRWEGRVVTRFERRGLETGRSIHDITAVKTSASAPNPENP